MQHPPDEHPAVSIDQIALGSTIRELRARHAITQEQLGFRAGLHRNYVGAIERGEINPTFRTLLRVTQGLEVRLSVLVAGYEERRPAPSPAGPSSTPGAAG